MTDRSTRAAVGLIKQTENKVLRLDLCVPERVGMLRGSAKHVAHRRTITGRCLLWSRSSRADVAAQCFERQTSVGKYGSTDGPLRNKLRIMGLWVPSTLNIFEDY